MNEKVRVNSNGETGFLQDTFMYMRRDADYLDRFYLLLATMSASLFTYISCEVYLRPDALLALAIIDLVACAVTGQMLWKGVDSRDIYLLTFLGKFVAPLTLALILWISEDESKFESLIGFST